jgi:hypothetical protein
MTLAVVTMDGGVIREQSYGAIAPNTVESDAESLAIIAANTVREELPVFLKAK